ncbi:hypothetical protein GCM10023214_29720 [Amycolatopsis dongchuanensis]|uniref:Uncharacterized protein n=1 Tax=Amycolatopsis dongchuanensis TaxID=1070866 RepID=A0ABP9QIX0_9PSEU
MSEGQRVAPQRHTVCRDIPRRSHRPQRPRAAANPRLPQHEPVLAIPRSDHTAEGIRRQQAIPPRPHPAVGSKSGPRWHRFTFESAKPDSQYR